MVRSIHLRCLVLILSAEHVDFDVTFKLFEELLALLPVNFIREDDSYCDHIPVVVQNFKILLDRYLAVVELLNLDCILHDLRLKVSLSAGINTLEHDDVPTIQDCCVMDGHFVLYFNNYIF